MKKHLFFFVLLLSVAYAPGARAQITTWCGIWFDYDAAGNRIKRYPACKDMDPNGILVPTHGHRVTRNSEIGSFSNQAASPTVSPNPTDGIYTIKLPIDTGSCHFHWYDSKGSLLRSDNFRGSGYSGSIAEYPPGNYMLVLRWNGKNYTFSIVKHN